MRGFQCCWVDKNANYWGFECTWMLRLFVCPRKTLRHARLKYLGLGTSFDTASETKHAAAWPIFGPQNAALQPGLPDLWTLENFSRLSSRRKTAGNRPYKPIPILKRAIRVFKIRSRIFLKVPELQEIMVFLSLTVWFHLKKADKTGHLKKQFFAPSFHQTQKYETICIFFLSAFYGRFGGIWVWGSFCSLLGAVVNFRFKMLLIFCRISKKTAKNEQKSQPKMVRRSQTAATQNGHLEKTVFCS